MTTRNYVSTALPSTLSSSVGSSGNLVVAQMPGTWPTSYPYAVLVDWGTTIQEAVMVTGAATGSGPYTLPSTRGIDGTTAQSHGAGAVVVHGTTSYEPALVATLGANILTPTSKSATYTASPGDLVKADVSGGGWTITLPTAPAANTTIGAKIVTQVAAGAPNTLTVACGPADVFEKSGGSTTATLTMLSQGATWQYNSGYWTRISDDLPLGQLDDRYGKIFSPLTFGAAGNGATDDTTAVLAANTAAAAVNGVVDFGAYTFKTSSPIPLSSVTYRGAGLAGGGIVNTASDIFSVSGTLSGFAVRDCKLTASGGHVWNCASGTIIAFGEILNVAATQNSASYGIWYMPTTGVYLDMTVGDGCTFQAVATATVAPWLVVGQANSNRWRSCRVSMNGAGATVPFFQVECDSASAWSSSLSFKDITVEGCLAGIIYGYTVDHVSIENVCGYDVTTYTDTLFSFSAGSGALRSQNIMIRNSGRVNGALGSGAYDVFCASGTQAILIENVGSETGASSYNTPSAYTTIIGGEGSTGFVKSPSLTAAGIAPTPANARFIGGSTIGGSPASGTWNALDTYIDSAGTIWVCTTAGTPGTWTAAGTSQTAYYLRMFAV